MPDLARLPITFDGGAINLAEGVRAALSVAVLVAASAYLYQPGLIWSALAALFACLCDLGGPIRRRVPALLSFAVAGALIVVVGSLASGAGVAVALPFGVLAIFCCTFVRIYGPQSQQVGQFLGVIAILSLDQHPASLGDAVGLGCYFLAGALWATLLTLVLWPLYPFKPARRALGLAYAALADMARDLEQLLARHEADAMAWETHARAQRGRVRSAIEAARTIILDIVRVRGPVSQRAAVSLLRLESADQLFGAMIALGERLELSDEAEHEAAAHMIRRLRPLLTVIGHEMEANPSEPHPQIARSVDAMSRDITALPPGNPLRTLTEIIITRLRVVLTVANTADSPVDAGPGEPTPRRWSALRSRFVANLNRESIPLRHALRAATTAAPALAYTLIHDGRFDHWLTITILVTMQPYFGNTFARALERTGGTVLGGLIAAVIGLFVTSSIGIAMVMFPLAIAVFALRQVSFGLFISGLTPMIVLIIELGLPDTDDWQIAATRVVLTLAGGVIAVAGCYLLWPSWEPNRLRGEVADAIAAHGRYAEAELSFLLGETSEAKVHAARRAAGLASNNVEASVARALLEPGSASNGRLEAAMVIDAALRRLAGRIAAMQFDPAQKAALTMEQWRSWRAWLTGAMAGLVAGNTELSVHPDLEEGVHTEALGRIARQVELIAGTIARVAA